MKKVILSTLTQFPFWAAAPKGAMSYTTGGFCASVRPYVRPSVPPGAFSQASEAFSQASEAFTQALEAYSPASEAYSQASEPSSQAFEASSQASEASSQYSEALS